MARKRIIDPEYWSDEEIGSWSFEARLFYIGIWNFADDEGRFKAHPLLLRAQIFPYDHKIDIEKLKNEVSGKIQWYETDGSKYGYVRNFLKYQKMDRPTKSKLPLPEVSASPQRALSEPSASPQEQLVPNRIEENRREVWYDLEFLLDSYPNRDGRKRALEYLKRSIKTNEDWDKVNVAVKNYLASEKVRKGYIKNCSTFFNNWQDWVEVPQEDFVAELPPKFGEE